MLGSEGRVLRYCSHHDCKRFKHPSDFDESEGPRATCRKHKKEPPEAKKESQGHEARVHGATARDAGGEGLMEGTYIMGNETEEPPAKQQCLSPRGGARVHAPARSPGDSTRSDIDEDSEAEPERCANFSLEEVFEMLAEATEATTTTPATAPRSDIDEDSEADMGFVFDTFSPDEMMDATAPERYALEDIQKLEGFGFLEGHDLGVHPEGGDLGMRGDNSLQWEDS